MLDRTSSLELMIAIGGHADRLGFEAIRTRALTRQIEVMTDPIDKLLRNNPVAKALHELARSVAPAEGGKKETWLNSLFGGT